MTTSGPIETGQETSEPERVRKHPEAKCEECPYYEQPFAPGAGPDTAQIVCVGEAPGFQEAKQGKVFVGPSGKLLNSVLEHHGIKREAVYVDNIVACRPPDNETPSKLAIKCCFPRLKDELHRRLRDGGTIVALGNTANQALQGTSDGITKSRVGPPKTYEPAGHKGRALSIVPTFHPAACLRSSDSFPHFVTDIGKVADLVNGIVRVKWEAPVFKVFDTNEDAVGALEEVGRRFEELVVDIEAGFEKDTEFDHPDQYQMLCIGLSYQPGKAIVVGEEALKHRRVQAELGKLLKTKKWIAHNGKFDLAGLRRYGESALYFDTMLASYVDDERPGTNGLKYLAAEFLGAPAYDSDIKKYLSKGDSYAVIPRDVLYRYNAYDVACTWLLKEMYEEKLDPELRKVHDFLVETSPTLMDMEIEGMKVDIPYLDHLTEHYLDGLAELEKPLEKWVKNPRSWKQVQEAFVELGVKTDSTDEEHLKAIRERAQLHVDRNQLSTGELNKQSEVLDFVNLLLQHRREQKLYGTYVKGTRKRMRKSRVHPTLLLHGTTTGRLACRNPNLQNVPRESSIRRLFVPEEGNIFVQADYATIELRVLATLARDPYLKKIFDEGRDIHDEFSLQFYGPEFTKEQRIRTKAFVYGLSYGREAPSIAQEYKIPLREAQAQMDAFFQAIPNVVAFREQVRNSILRDQDDLVTPFGRHRRFWLITKENQKDVVKEGLAFIPQSTASDINLKASNRLAKELPKEARLRLLVHDSILVECPIDMRYNIAKQMTETMETVARESYDDFVPFPADVEMGYSWGDLQKVEI